VDINKCDEREFEKLLQIIAAKQMSDKSVVSE